MVISKYKSNVGQPGISSSRIFRLSLTLRMFYQSMLMILVITKAALVLSLQGPSVTPECAMLISRRTNIYNVLPSCTSGTITCRSGRCPARLVLRFHSNPSEVCFGHDVYNGSVYTVSTTSMETYQVLPGKHPCIPELTNHDVTITLDGDDGQVVYFKSTTHKKNKNKTNRRKPTCQKLRYLKKLCKCRSKHTLECQPCVKICSL